MVKRLLVSITVAVGALLLASCSDGVVRMPDAYDGEQIDVRLDQAFEIELGTDRMINNDPEVHEWVLLDPGVLNLVSEKHGTRPEGDDEFIGGYSRHTIFMFEPMAAGTGNLVFGYFPVGVEDAEPVNTFVVRINATP